MKKRRVFMLGVVIVVVILIALLGRKKSPPQIITLPNGEQYQFVAAEWGTNEIQPTFAARFVARLPGSLANYVMQKNGNRLGIVTPLAPPGLVLVSMFNPGQIKPPDPSLHIWFRSLSTNTTGTPLDGGLKFMLADKNGVVSGRGSSRWLGFSYGGDMWETFGQGTNRWLKFTLPVVPRRSEMLQLHLFQADDVIETLRIQNPLYGNFPNWQPEPLPATKTAGDLRVHLTDFSVGVAELGHQLARVNGVKTQFRPARPSENPRVVFKLDFLSPRTTNETWQVSHAELSDATGNHVRNGNLSISHVTGEYSFGPALWPDEAAWRLKLTLKRSRGFDPEELVTFTNTPVPAIGAANITFLTNRIQGVPIILKQVFTRRPDVVTNAGGRWMPPTEVVAEVINPPEGFVVAFDRLTADAGWSPSEWGFGQPRGAASINLNSIPTNLTTLSFTWVVQKTRTVEFFVKPPTLK